MALADHLGLVRRVGPLGYSSRLTLLGGAGLLLLPVVLGADPAADPPARTTAMRSNAASRSPWLLVALAAAAGIGAIGWSSSVAAALGAGLRRG